jgi:hypothetical protein
MTRKELYNICHDEAVAYANSEQWSKRTGEEKSFLIQGYLDAMMEARKSEITEKKKSSPKTYEECIGKLPINWDGKVEGYKCDLLTTFQKLLICRDAYWKIAGEEMGLGKPWEPDGNPVYAITRNDGCIVEIETGGNDEVFEFPTPEMRDAFKENFDPDIEICKEFL